MLVEELKEKLNDPGLQLESMKLCQVPDLVNPQVSTCRLLMIPSSTDRLYLEHAIRYSLRH